VAPAHAVKVPDIRLESAGLSTRKSGTFGVKDADFRNAGFSFGAKGGFFFGFFPV
jgi:hypothetical protein